jgi:pyruvate formate lyase activating enzyme
MTGIMIDLKRFAVHDGPGIRTTLFLKGCSLRCRWCHNPESIFPKPEIGLRKKKCRGCRKCEVVCPTGAHTFLDGTHLFDRTKCIACGKCVDVCLPGALEYYGREITVDAAVEEILKDRNFYAHSGGGATISGGEPLLQAEFCAEVFKALKDEGIHCAIDTSGAVAWEAFEKVLPYTDLFLYDVKQTDDTLHREHTGGSNHLILNNLKRLSQYGVPIEIRIPVIPGFNADEASFDAISKFLNRIPHIMAVRLLSYHDLARSKYEMIGHPDTMPHVPVPTSEQMHVFAEKLIKLGIPSQFYPMSLG